MFSAEEDSANISPLLKALRQAKAEGRLADAQEQMAAEFEALKLQAAPKIVINRGGAGEDVSGGEEEGVVANGHVVQFRDPDTQEAFDTLQEMSKNEQGMFDFVCWFVCLV